MEQFWCQQFGSQFSVVSLISDSTFWAHRARGPFGTVLASAALEYIKWFAQKEVQDKWWKAGGYSALKAVVEDTGFVTSQPYAKTFLDSMAIVKDFWAEPAYADLLLPMQERVHDYVIAGKGTAQEALDGLVDDWTEVLEDEGKL